MKTSCVYIPRNKKGEELKGFQEYKKNLGYKDATQVFTKALSKSFQNDFKRYITLDSQGIPTYNSVMKIPYIKDFLGATKLIALEQKKYPPVQNTRENYERLVNQAYLFNTTSENKDTLTAIVQKTDSKGNQAPSPWGRDGEGLLGIFLVPKNNSNDAIARNQYGTTQLNKKLADIFAPLGVTVELLEEYEAKTKDGMVDFSNATLMADGFSKLIRIANNAEGVEALPEEFAHLIIGVLHDNPLVQRSLNILKDNNELVKDFLGDEYQAIANSYKEDENKDSLIAEEALGRVLQDQLKQVNSKTYNSSLLTSHSSLKRLLERLINYIKSLFIDYDINDVISAKDSVNDTMGKLASDFLNGKKTITKEDIANSKRNAILNHLRDDIDKTQQLLQNAIETERKRLKVMRGSDTEFNRTIRNRINNLNSILSSKEYVSGIIDYAKSTLEDIADANANLDIVSDLPNETRFKVLSNIGIVIDSYRDFVNDFHEILEDNVDVTVDINDEQLDLRTLWRRLNDVFKTTENRYNKEILPSFISFVAPLYTNNPLKDKDGKPIPIERLFKTATKEDVENGLMLNEDIDISTIDKWAFSLGNSGSMIAQFFDKIIKKAKDKARLQTMKNTREIWKLREEAESLGITSFEWMFEKDRNNKKTGNYISEYNTGQFWQDYNNMIKSLHEKYGKAPIGNDYINFTKERKQWISEHAANVYGTPCPNEGYRNKDYDRLTTNQKKVLESFLEYKNKLEKDLPKSRVYKTKAIQRRKSDAQRLIDSASSPSTLFENIAEDISSAFKRKADDDQYYGNTKSGLSDFTGKEFMTVPLFYTSKLENPDELSTDIFSDLMAYAYSTNTYREMDNIVDPIKIGQQAIKQKRLLKTRGNKPLIETVNVNGVKTKNLIYADDTENNLQRKIQEIVECQVYNRYLKDQGEVLGVDTQKLVSFGMKYTSLMYLGFNYLAGVANVGTAIGMQNIEAAAKQFFSAKDLLAADKEYATMLPEFLADLGSRNKTSKLALFDELFDIKQDYKGKVIKTQKKNLLQRMFGTNIMFLQQGCGDHWIYNRTGIAMAKHTQVLLNGKKVSLWDALEIIDDPKSGKKIMQARQGVKSIDGTAFNAGDFSRKIAHINHSIAGIYNDDDQNAANRVAVGRILQQMRKWIVPQFARRFQDRRSNLDIGTDEEGYYRTAWHYLSSLVSETARAKYQIPKEWSKLSENDKANLRRAAFEISQFLALWFLLHGLTLAGAWGDDNDRPWALAFAEYMLNREVHELGFLALSPSMVTEGVKTIQSPAVMASAVGDIAKVINVASNPNNWITEVKSGKYKGYNKVEAAFLKSPIPPLPQIRNIGKFMEDLDTSTKYYSKDY